MSQHIGILNVNSDLADLIDTRRNKSYGGFCTSLKCCEYYTPRNEKRYKPRVLKHSGTGVEVCPDCGNTLVFRENKNGILGE